MKLWIVGIAVAAGILHNSASASGMDLLAQCHEAVKGIEGDMNINMLSAGKCFGMSEGVRNTLQILNSNLPPNYQTCFPKNGINNEQAVRIITKYLENNPVMLDNNDSFLALMAFKDAYPCK